MYFILFFMLIEAKTFESNLYKWLPMDDKSTAILKKELNALVFSNAIGIPLVALVQGIFGLLGYWIAGVQEPFIWFVATCVAAVIPVLGSAFSICTTAHYTHCTGYDNTRHFFIGLRFFYSRYS